MRIEFASSTDSPSFRIYRIVGPPSDLSFVRDVQGPEQLVIFDGDEGAATTLHHETELRLQKLTPQGQLLARGLLPLRFLGIYIAIDQVQLTARSGSGWDERLHARVLDVLRTALAPLAVDVSEISWNRILIEPDEVID